MKKLIILSLITVIFFGCKNDVGEDMKKVNSNGITYFKDESTGLCFAKINSSTYYNYEVASISCVPCDSLNKIGLK